jgi:hypothetical protein
LVKVFASTIPLVQRWVDPPWIGSGTFSARIILACGLAGNEIPASVIPGDTCRNLVLNTYRNRRMVSRALVCTCPRNNNRSDMGEEQQGEIPIAYSSLDNG